MECPSGYYSDLGSQSCKICHSTCLACFGPGANQCLSCQADLNFMNETNTCA